MRRYRCEERKPPSELDRRVLDLCGGWRPPGTAQKEAIDCCTHTKDPGATLAAGKRAREQRLPAVQAGCSSLETFPAAHGLFIQQPESA